MADKGGFFFWGGEQQVRYWPMSYGYNVPFSYENCDSTSYTDDRLIFLFGFRYIASRHSILLVRGSLVPSPGTGLAPLPALRYALFSHIQLNCPTEQLWTLQRENLICRVSSHLATVKLGPRPRTDQGGGFMRSGVSGFSGLLQQYLIPGRFSC